jgi:hypothetical protein
MMITYIGLDLGVNTSVVTNSASVRLSMRSPTKLHAAADGDGQSVEFAGMIFDISRSINNNTGSESI